MNHDARNRDDRNRSGGAVGLPIAAQPHRSPDDRASCCRHRVPSRRVRIWLPFLLALALPRAGWSASAGDSPGLFETLNALAGQIPWSAFQGSGYPDPSPPLSLGVYSSFPFIGPLDQNGFPLDHGFTVNAPFERDGLAERLGLLPDDILVEMNGEPILSIDETHDRIAELQAGDTLGLLVLRDGKPVSVSGVIPDPRTLPVYQRQHGRFGKYDRQYLSQDIVRQYLGMKAVCEASRQMSLTLVINALRKQLLGYPPWHLAPYGSDTAAWSLEFTLSARPGHP